MLRKTLESRGQESDRGSEAMFYKIVVDGELTERFAGAFEGMKLEAESGQTIITGQVVDQSHLHGILNRICGLGLSLVSVETLPHYAQGKGGATRANRE
jgi:hypothetical protein